MWLVPLMALAAVVPLIAHGCSCGHDFDFHLLNWIEAAHQLRHGNLHPDWAFTPAYNAGEPRFVFYPPLSWYLGALIGLALTHLPRIGEAAAWNATPIVFTWMALTAAGLAMYRLAREYAAPGAAAMATAVYLANPYMLFTAYERTAYAELLAAAWMPLLFLAVLRPKLSVVRIAVPLALLWLTNAPAAVMGSYTLGFLVLARMVSARWARGSERNTGKVAGQIALKGAAGAGLGLGLAALYIVPAAWERRYVLIQMALVPGMRIGDNFLFGHTTGPDAAEHDLVLHTASVVACVLLTAAAGMLVVAWMRHDGAMRQPPRRTLAALTAGIGFLLLPPSAWLWRVVPQAEFLQFPWRLLAVLAVVAALLIGGGLARWRFGAAAMVIAPLALAAMLAGVEWHEFAQRCYPEDTPAATVATYDAHAGSEATDEYTPVDADNDALRAGSAPYWLANSPKAASPVGARPGSAPMRLRVMAERAEYLMLDLRDYPVWSITLDGVPAATVKRSDGLVALAVPAGMSVIEVHHRWPADRRVGDAVSLLAMGMLLVLLRRGMRSSAAE